MALFAFVGGHTQTGRVSRVNLDTGAIVEAVSNAFRVAFANNKLYAASWNLSIAANDPSQEIHVFDPITMTRTTTLTSAGIRNGLAVVNDTIFAKGYSSAPGDLITISTISDSVTNTYDVRGITSSDITYKHNSVWTLRSEDDAGSRFTTMRVYRVDPADGTIQADISTGNNSTNQINLLSVTATSSTVYVSDSNERIYRIDPDTDTLLGTDNVRTELGFTAPANISATRLTTDGTNAYFITDLGGLYKIDASGVYSTLNATANDRSITYHEGRIYVAGGLSPNKTQLEVYDLSGTLLTSYDWVGGQGGSDVCIGDLAIAGWGVNTINW